ncbi:MAG: 16S rRNA (guanine(527)-N(7))-methyltransferase RsmG [Candidatus Accumulibacter sp.]|jgi:16S rRNA (guanine527-N7)-methyltransferase|nr:16S rRNA (guanine(527)-N(7))-methyltransferase RsmG [Accumulibacter sp.]
MMERLALGLSAMSLSLPDTAREKLLAYLALLEKWNKTYSLTALRAPETALSHHALDSLSILPFVEAAADGNLLDVGSGGGMPGIPLAIALPELEITLAERNSKKAAFLCQAKIELELANISVHGGRVEQYHPPFGFSVIVSRAFSSLRDFVNLSRHLLAENGRWFAMKGLWPKKEIDGLPDDIGLDTVHRLRVPGVEGERHLAVLKIKSAD